MPSTSDKQRTRRDGSAGESVRTRARKAPPPGPIDERSRPPRRDGAAKADAGRTEEERRAWETRAEPKKSLSGFPRRHPYATIAIVAAVLLVAAGVVLWWLHARQFESTDDAFIDARTVTVSAEVSGAITAVPVTDNQLVQAGAVLARIDDSDYRAALDQAKATVAQAEAAVANADAQIEAQGAKIEQARRQAAQAKAALDYANKEKQRTQELLKTGAGTQQAAQQAASTQEQDQAAYGSAEANVTAAEKQSLVLEAGKKSAAAQLAQARAGERQAEVTLSRTRIVAPTAGRATSISAAVGGYAQPGQALMMFVPEKVWVTANFKETQLDLMRPGQPVEIRIDAYPERRFHGHVDSIQAGSGTAFSLLPAQNATGNYVKVVQRVPVKIVFDKPPDVYLGPGMSVVPTVKVR